ncbi:MAG: sugar transferase [Lachnospiraceae bacterium]|nr:sugar transferase [Lachnospiraceae bacterium]
MYKYIKRILDIIASLVFLIVFSPVMLVVVLAIKIDSKGPVLFPQERIGLHRKPFTIYKFRTMRVDTPKNIPTGELHNPDEYITRVGNFLRKTSLDELPQLINILKGEMSLIGPRPLIKEDSYVLDLRDTCGANDTLPGLTGWAQINGRDMISDEEKARLDGEYVKNMSFSFDLKCFIGTLFYVLKAEDVVEGYQEDKEK